MKYTPQQPLVTAGVTQPEYPVAITRAGFSLVELALALLVVSVGLISIIGLFPASLDMSKKAINETYATFLADSAIASYREAAHYVPWDELANYSPIGPNTISKGGYENTDVFWRNSDELRLIADNTVRTQVFAAASTPEKWAPGSGLSITPMEDHSLRYRLRIEDVDVTNDPRLKRLVLEVWLGQFGKTSNEKPEVFYAEIFRHRYVP